MPKSILRLIAGIGISLMLVLASSGMASAAIRIKSIYFDPPGSDTGKLNQEYVIIENTGSKAKSLKGWTLRDKVPHVFKFGTFTLKPGKVVRVRTGSGGDDKNDVYQDSGSFIWNNDGDKATLKRPNGKVVDSCTYPSSASSPAGC